jgi:hypothetical protein
VIRGTDINAIRTESQHFVVFMYGDRLTTLFD